MLTSQIRSKSYMTHKSYYEVAKEMNNPTINPFIELIERLSEMKNQMPFEDFFDEIVKTIQVEKLSKGYYDLERRKNNISAFKQMLIEFFEEDYSRTFKDFINQLSLKPEASEINNKVKLMTIHQAKGLESKVVFIVDARDEMMPGKKKGINLEEERRVFYVGITRAKEELYLVTTEKNGPNDKHRCVASRFISEIYK